LGPDASSVGWIFQYALVDTTGQRSLADLRSYQDNTVRPWLRSVPGVADVASVGGFEKQIQVQLNPALMSGYNVSVAGVIEGIRRNNGDFGARLIELSGAEYMIRGHGAIANLDDIANTPVPRGHRAMAVSSDGHGTAAPTASSTGNETPVLIRQLGQASIG